MEDLIEQTKKFIMLKYPVFGAEIANANFIYTKDLSVKTAATDGKNIYIDPDYFASLSENDRAFLMAHEILHIVFKHMYRFENNKNNIDDLKLWNIATDAIINANLEKDGFVIREDYINKPESINYTAEEYYEILKQQLERNKANRKEFSEQKFQSQSIGDETSYSQENQDYSNITEGKKLVDNHEIWQNKKNQAKENEQETSKKENNQSKNADSQEKSDNNAKISSDQNQSSNNSFSSNSKEAGKTGGGKNLRENDGLDAQNIGINEKQVFEENRQLRKKLFKELKQKQTKKLKHIYNDNNKNDVKIDIGTEKSILDWKKILKAKMDNSETIWSKRRTTTSRLEDIDDDSERFTEVLIDTSASVSRELVISFLRQIKILAKNTKLSVACFDNNFYGFQKINNKNDVDNFKISGGYGTNFDYATSFFTRKKEVNRIVFTDGYDSYNGDDNEIIWIVYDNKNFKPSCGRVINVTTSEIMNGENAVKNDDEYLP